MGLAANQPSASECLLSESGRLKKLPKSRALSLGHDAMQDLAEALIHTKAPVASSKIGPMIKQQDKSVSATIATQ